MSLVVTAAQNTDDKLGSDSTKNYARTSKCAPPITQKQV